MAQADAVSLCLQKVDAAELLRLYLNYDLLEEAADLVLEYVDAVLGKGHQYFGIEVSSLGWAGLARGLLFAMGTRQKGSSPLQHPLSATAPMVWLPYTAIDQLLQALQESTTNHYNIMVGGGGQGEAPHGAGQPCCLLFLL